MTCAATGSQSVKVSTISSFFTSAAARMARFAAPPGGDLQLHFGEHRGFVREDFHLQSDSDGEWTNVHCEKLLDDGCCRSARRHF